MFSKKDVLETFLVGLCFGFGFFLVDLIISYIKTLL